MCCKFIFAGALLLSVGVSTGEAVDFPLDSGGVSFRCSEAVPEQAVTESANYVTDGTFDRSAAGEKTWGTLTCIHSKTIPPELKSCVAGAVSGSGIRTGENPFYRLQTSTSIRPHQTPDGLPMISNRISQQISWDGTESRVRLTFRGRGGVMPGSTVKGWQGLFVFTYFWGKQRYVPIARENYRAISLNREFQSFSMEFNVPRGTRYLFLEFSLYHAAVADLDDIRLEKVKKTDMEAALFPFYVYPNEAFHIEQGVPAILNIRMKRNDRTPYKNTKLILELPAGVEILGMTQPARIGERKENRKNTCYSIDLKTIAERNSEVGVYSRWGGIDIAIKTSLPPSAEILSGAYHIENNGKSGSGKTFRLKVIPPSVPVSPRLRRFVSGASGFDLVFDRDTADALLRMFTAFGFNAVKGLLNQESREAVQKYNVGTYGEIWHIMNGYRLGSKPKPEGTAFIQADGTPLVEAYGNAGHLCPEEVRARGAYYTGNVVGLMRDYVVRRGVWSNMAVNWEPCDSEKGCFCLKCREAFIRFSQLSGEEIRKIWPRGIKERHYEIWRKFRSFQHGILVATLDRDMKELAGSVGKKGAFIPIVEYSSLTSWWNGDFPAFNPVDYLDRIQAIMPFGPYFFYHTGLGGEQYFPCVHSLAFAAARECRDFIAAKVPDEKKRPGLFGYPLAQEFTGNSPWVASPEELAFDTLCFYVNQWKGSFAYLFPHGYDHRWFRAMGKAHSQIAATEEIVSTGVSDSSFFQLKPCSPLPEGDILRSYRKDSYMFNTLRQPQEKEISPVLRAGFKKGNVHLVAVGNSWTKGEAFFTLSLNCSGPRRWRVTIPGRDISLGEFSSGELNEGILVHTGALRWTFYRIEPADGHPIVAGSVLSQEHMREVYRKRLPALRKAAENESASIRRACGKNEELSGIGVLPKKIQSLKQSDVCSVPAADGKAFNIKTPVYEAKITPRGVIVSLRVRGAEAVSSQYPVGFIRDSFLFPGELARKADLPFSLQSASTFDRGIKLEFGLKLESGIVMNKEIWLTRETIRAATRIVNTSSRYFDFIFRYQNLPEAFENSRSRPGRASFSGEVGMAARKQENQLFRKMRQAEAAIDRRLDLPINCVGGKISSGMLKILPGGNLPEYLLKPSEPDLYGIYLWEGNNVALSPAATLEFIYRKISLPPAGEWNSSLQIGLYVK